MSNWNNKTRQRVCQEDGCTREFECKPFTNRKYCDNCQDLVRDAKHRAARKLRKAKPIVDHECGCMCGGCLGVESRRK
jgi:hypothetical protein